MTDEMVWALREKHRKGVTVQQMAETYGITTRVIAAVVGEEDDRDRYRRWKSADLWTIREMMREGCDMDNMIECFDADYKALGQVVLKNSDLFRPLDWRENFTEQ